MREKKEEFKSILSQREWYENTNISIRRSLEELPTDFIGAIKMVYDLPVDTDDKVFNRILSLTKGSSGLFLEIEYRSNKTNETFINDVYIPKLGDGQMSYGLIGIINDKEVTHLIIPKKQGIFNITKDWSSIGIYFPNFQNNDLLNLPTKITRDLRKIFEEDIKIMGFHDLGEIYSETSMSPKKISLFLITIKLSKKVGSASKELSELRLVDKKDLAKIIKQSKNPTLLSILAKIRSFDIL